MSNTTESATELTYPPEILVGVDKNDHVVTRFPPEPNGYLHIGHCKAMGIDFGLAEYVNGLEGKTAECILRFDDTNPGNGYEKYIDHIKENMNWLGYTPSKVTYTSNYFDNLYELAIRMIKDGNAYVCDLSGDDISLYRKEKKNSPGRDRSVEENLRLFTEMTEGRHPDGSYTLRMRGDLEDPDPCMWDLVFYRISHKPHHRTGDKWCVYPSYDFSHCIVDSLEGVTHSLCSKEFENRRKSYFWLLDVLGLRAPIVYEFARFNVDGYNLSKRYIKKLVEDGVVKSWEDPSLLTLEGMKAKGYSPTAIKEFCELTGVTKTDSSLPMEKLYTIMSRELDPEVERRVAIVDPLEVVIDNFNDLTDFDKRAVMYNHPMYMRNILKGDTEGIDERFLTTRHMELTGKIYINRKDFRVMDEKKYYGLAPGKMARLRYSDYFKCVGYDEEDGEVKRIHLEKVVPERPKKVRGVLLWVNSDNTPVTLTNRYVRDGEFVVDRVHCVGENSLRDLAEGERIQLEKVGYFMRSSNGDDNTDRVELECICELRSSYK